jgi:hypothetical protein
MGFPVCYGSPSDVFAASSGGGGKGQSGKCTAFQVCWQTWIFIRSVGYIRISPECLPVNLNFAFILLEKKSRKWTQRSWKPFLFEKGWLTLRFLASGDSNVSLQYLFTISKQAISCLVPEVCESLAEKLKDYIQVRQILLFVFYERSWKLDCNQNFYLNKNFTETLLLTNGPNYSKNTCILIFSSEDAVAGEMLSVEKVWGKGLNGDGEVFPEHEGEGFWE